MKKRLLIGSLCFISFATYSQEVIATQGDSYSNANGSVDFTVGEVVIFTGSDGNNDVTQGFHQTNWNFAGLIDHQPEVLATLYPNPTENTLVIKTEAFEGVTYLMTDATGRVVREGSLTDLETSVDVKDFAPGNYNVTLLSSELALKTFKLIKN